MTPSRQRTEFRRGSQQRPNKTQNKFKKMTTSCLVKPVLCVGNAVVDCISVVDKFPQEDSEQIGVQYYWQRGGNATNNCTVLSQFGVPCEFMGVLTTIGSESKWLLDDFHRAAIPTDHCVTSPGQCPLAVCIVSHGTGSRTILAYPRDCPELTHAQFKEEMKGDFSQYSWVHFELRSQTAEVMAMMKDVNIFNKSKRIDDEGSAVIVSVEVENPTFLHPEQVMCEADFVFISKEFAKSRGCTNIHQALEHLYVHCRPGSVLICAWGERGAGAKYNKQIFLSSARTGVTVVDSLGAGDTFTAGFICSILQNNEDINIEVNTPPVSVDRSLKIERALEYGCQLAGYKCGIHGYQGLQGFDKKINT